jgi:hypothetical protein
MGSFSFGGGRQLWVLHCAALSPRHEELLWDFAAEDHDNIHVCDDPGSVGQCEQARKSTSWLKKL